MLTVTNQVFDRAQMPFVGFISSKSLESGNTAKPDLNLAADVLVVEVQIWMRDPAELDASQEIAPMEHL